jgi:hypothetical protein
LDVNRFRVVRVSRRLLLPLALGLGCLTSAVAEPLSKKIDIDFFRDVPSRNLKGLASRSDGRLVSGPVVRELTGQPPADILWSLEPDSTAGQWLVGTGPDGRIFELAVDASATSFTSRELAKLDDPQVFALKRLPDGAVLAGTSPKGGLHLLREGITVARAGLPADSVFDLLVVDANTILIATGNPGRIYRIDVNAFAARGITSDRITDSARLAERGITLFGEIRDRNVRRLAALPDGRIVAGSAPRGNVYAFARDGGAPVILQENRDAEVTDLLPQPNGDLYAAIVFSTTSNVSRLTPPASATKGGAKEDVPPPPPAQVERFGGRSAVIWFPAQGFPEVLAARANTAIYRLQRRGDVLLMAGGEQGELLGYDLTTRLAVTFSGSVSSQLNGFTAIPGSGTDTAPDRYLLLRNNAPGFAVLDFAAGGPREAETRRLDLATASTLGALRFNRIRALPDTALKVDVRTSNGTDDVEGWAPWTPLVRDADGGWRAGNLRGRYARVRIQLEDTAAAAGDFELDRAALHGLPQNRRPLLQDFRILSPGLGLVPAPELPPPATVTLSQVVQTGRDDVRRSNFMSSQVVRAPGTQVVLWTVTDPDGDVLLNTFSIRRDGESTWTDLVAASRENFAQFDTRHLADGVYFTRLVVTEAGPRPAADRLSRTFETDQLIIDHTPPELLAATVERTADGVRVTVRGRDTLSLLDGIEVTFNNGVRESLEQPADGIRDGREETFVLELPLARVSNATSLEVTLYDLAGNGAARRLGL